MEFIDTQFVIALENASRSDVKLSDYYHDKFSCNFVFDDNKKPIILTGLYKDITSEHYPVQFGYSSLINIGKFDYLKLIDNVNSVISYLHLIESLYVNSTIRSHYLNIYSKFLDFETLMFLKQEAYYNIQSSCYELIFCLKKDGAVDNVLYLYQLIGEHIFEFYFMDNKFKMNIKKRNCSNISKVHSIESDYNDLKTFKEFVSNFLYDFYVFPKIGIKKEDFNIESHHILEIYNI